MAGTHSRDANSGIGVLEVLLVSWLLNQPTAGMLALLGSPHLTKQAWFTVKVGMMLAAELIT